MNPEIFREYDIRGVAEKDLNALDVVKIGQAFGTFVRRKGYKTVTVGKDCRLTGDKYAVATIKGLLSTGCDVFDIGMVPTPVSYFSTIQLNADASLMVSASHNPKEYNGFKMMCGGDAVYGEDIQKLHQMILDDDFFQEPKGQLRVEDVLIPYINYIINHNIVLSGKRFRVGVDCANGVAGLTAIPILKALGCEVHELYVTPDGNFPNHEADPTINANMKELISLVREKKLDVGFGFDGDGDRIGVVDEKGTLLFGDQLLIIFSREILSRIPGALFVSEIKCSQATYDDIKKHGGRGIMWKAGHSLIKQKLKKEKAALAAEVSGHIFFADRYFGFDDAVYAACRLLEILSATGKSVSALLEGVPKRVITPEIRMECPDDVKFKIVEKAVAYFKKEFPVIDIDGIRFQLSDGWGLVRASNTQPALVLRFEAPTQKRVEEIKTWVLDVLAQIRKEV